MQQYFQHPPDPEVPTDPPVPPEPTDPPLESAQIEKELL